MRCIGRQVQRVFVHRPAWPDHRRELEAGVSRGNVNLFHRGDSKGFKCPSRVARGSRLTRSDCRRERYREQLAKLS